MSSMDPFCASYLCLCATGLLRVASIHITQTLAFIIMLFLFPGINSIKYIVFWASAVLGLQEMALQRGILSGYWILQSLVFQCLNSIRLSRSTSFRKPSQVWSETRRDLWSWAFWSIWTVALSGASNCWSVDSSAIPTKWSTMETLRNSVIHLHRRVLEKLVFHSNFAA